MPTHLSRPRPCEFMDFDIHSLEANMKYLALPTVIMACLLMTGCVGFESQWKQSITEYHAGKISHPEGPWTGTWTTKTNGHTGALRAIVTKAPNVEYDFRYHATWAKILQGGYKVRFPATRSGSTYTVDGSKDLGIFGDFGHRATITPDSYEASYSNDKGDLGSFYMTRPE